MILQTQLPYPGWETRKLPGVQPLDPAEWIVFDEAEPAQLREKARLLATNRAEVLATVPGSEAAQAEALEAVLTHLARDHGRHPDVSGPPLEALSRIVQDDIVIMEKQGDEHVLTAALLCFPASWRLSEKIGRPLGAIHDPVASYDSNVARRVQRLFDGLQVGRPLWRWNTLWYDDPALFQPRSASEPRHHPDGAPFFRSERQCLVRLPRTGAVVFSIHTYVLRAQDVDQSAASLPNSSNSGRSLTT
ncbi:MAG: DUF3445 domain-containing protein [Pseudomonadota bacterium]